MATKAATAWVDQWLDIEDATYLNTAARALMPRVSIDAVLTALETNRFPRRADDAELFDVSSRLRTSLAAMIGAKREEIALTTGASTGVAAVANLLTWRPGDEIVTAAGEFPLHYATWKPLEERDGVTLRFVAPREQFVTADDLIAAVTPRTRIVSVSHVRFDDGSLVDAARVADACHAQGALLLLDVSQSCGAVPLDVNQLGADFAVCAGYKWLLGPHGTGFFWARTEHLEAAPPGPFYWMAQEGETFSALNFVDPRPSRSARRWDAAEATTDFNLNVIAMDASVDFVKRVGPEAVLEHNHRLIDALFDRLPEQCVAATPRDRNRRGPYGCFRATTAERTAALYEQLRQEKIVVSLRAGSIRVSPHLFNSVDDIDRVIRVVS